MHICEQTFGEPACFGACLDFMETAGANKEFTLSYTCLPHYAQLVIALEVVDHLHNGRQCYIGIIQYSATGMRDDVVPLRRAERLSGELGKGGMFRLDTKSHCPDRHRLSHPLADISKHWVAPKVCAVKAWDGVGDCLWKEQHMSACQ